MSIVQQNCTEQLVPSAVLQDHIKELVIGTFYILFIAFGYLITNGHGLQVKSVLETWTED